MVKIENSLKKEKYYKVLYHVCCFFKVFQIVRFFSRKRIKVLLYHDPCPNLFEKHLQYLSKKYSIISLSQYSKYLESQSKQTLPTNSIIITIDDGHKGNYHLLPIIKKYNIQPTIYLCSSLVCTNRKYWWTVPSKQSFIEYLKTVPNFKRLDLLKSGYNFIQENNYENTERQALSKLEIMEMSDYFDFQSHTRFHPILTKCTLNEKTDELMNSKNELEILLGKKIEHFSYPNGDFDKTTIELLKSFGYKTARTTSFGLNGLKTDPFKINIIGVSEKESEYRIAFDLTGFPLIISNLMRKSLKLIRSFSPNN